MTNDPFRPSEPGAGPDFWDPASTPSPTTAASQPDPYAPQPDPYPYMPGASPYGAAAHPPQQPSPYGASPYQAPPYGSSPYGASPYRASPYGAAPYGSGPNIQPYPSYLAAPGYGVSQPLIDDPTGADAPLRGASLGEAFRRYWSRGLVTTGRASLSEYWWMAIIQPILIYGVLAMSAVIDLELLTIPVLAYILASIVPMITLQIRRLHDVNQSGWLLLLHLVPFGSLVLFVFSLMAANPAGARYDAVNRHRY